MNEGVDALGNYPLLPPLVSSDELSLVLGDDRVRIFDATVFLVRDVNGGPYRAQSGRAHYEEAHLPGASFADIPGELSDPGSPFRFTVPSAAHFVEAAGRLGIGNAHHVVAYAQESPTWATRLWWLLRYFGHDHVSVLDGDRGAWVASGRPLERGAVRYPETTFTAHPRPELLATLDEVNAIAGGAHPEPTQLVNALPREAFLGEVAGSYSRRGRIPTSVNLPSSNLLDRSNRFLAPGELRPRLRRGRGGQGRTAGGLLWWRYFRHRRCFCPLPRRVAERPSLRRNPFRSGALTHCCRSSPVELSSNGLMPLPVHLAIALDGSATARRCQRWRSLA